MARTKVTITIEDQPDGTVKTVISPSANTLLGKIASHGPQSMTPAETYGMACINHMLRMSSDKASSIIIPVPRVRDPWRRH